MRRSVALVPMFLLLLGAVPAWAAQTAFRITSISLRDPHAFVNTGDCVDITDPSPDLPISFNEILNSRIQQDNDGDGKFDQSYVLVFDPLDQTPEAGYFPAQLITGTHLCSLPEWMSACWPDFSPSFITPILYYNICAGVEPLTTHGYTPAITLPAAPCMAALVDHLYLDIGAPIHLFNATITATYVGNPATGLINGMIKGFLPEGPNESVMLPPAIFGENKPLLSLFPGDPGNCAGWSDQESQPEQHGWYMYFNFTAVKVTYTANGPVGVRDGAPALTLEAPHPNPFNPSTEIRYMLPRESRVSIAIFDAEGRLVRTLVDESQVRGEYSARWDGRTGLGETASSGVYFVKLTANGETRTQKMVLLK